MSKDLIVTIINLVLVLYSFWVYKMLLDKKEVLLDLMMKEECRCDKVFKATKLRYMSTQFWSTITLLVGCLLALDFFKHIF